MNFSRTRLRAVVVTSTVVPGLVIASLTGVSADAATVPAAAAAVVTPASLGVPSKATIAGVTLENSFVSSVGWVKPDADTAATGDSDGTYPTRLILTNSNVVDTPVTVALTAPIGTTLLSTSKPSEATVAAGGKSLTWTVTLPAATAGVPVKPTTTTLVVRQQADTLAETPTLVWRDISTSATLTVAAVTSTAAISHGPKVIPPNETYETARYGDRPFPIVPVQYRDRAYQSTHSGSSLESVINDPANEGSTFNLYQEMSLGQLYPNGSVPSVGITSKDFTYAPGFSFTSIEPGQTCTGVTGGASAPIVSGTSTRTDNLAYTERITNGIYNLPGQTQYYGADANGSAVIGSLAGVGALQAIDSGCGDTGKLVYDSAALADPEIDYSDFDTDKDGVVDFFMVVFAGCGGNGSSQLSVAGCDYPGLPYDNIWPHSSTLENGYVGTYGLPGFTTDDQLRDLEGNKLYYTDDKASEMTKNVTSFPVFVRVGPYNVNPETALDAASVISHEYGHSLGLPDFYSTGSRETYGDWNLMATDKSHNIDAFGRQELGWVVPEVLDSTRTENDITDSRQDTNRIEWRDADNNPYVLTEGQNGVGRVQNSQMYVAKLPGRQLLDPAAFSSGEGATPSHLWWSGSGNDFGCPPTGGRNFDLSIPQLADLKNPNATATLSFKSYWDIEWDFDYGFVLTTKDGGQTYTSHESQNGYTSSNTDPTAANPNSVACQSTYDNGITGTSGSYNDGTQAVDRKAGNTPPPVFLEDSYDISDLTGELNGALRFTYATDPGLARPGWFIDDVKITVDPDGAGGSTAPYDIYATDFETNGGPSDPKVFNGGCREDLTTAQQCTLGWKYLQAGAASPQDHAYYMEMRDRSGFDLDGNGEADRGAPEFGAGFYLSYTDEAHGYGNVGTDNPPAQSPLDSVPDPGNDTPDLNDAAFRATPTSRATFSDKKAAPHVDNYSDPSTASGDWEFAYDCLDFDVKTMSGEADGPQESDGDLTGSVAFTMGSGCGQVDYGYVPTAGTGGANSAPVAKAAATPTSVEAGTPVSLSAAGTTDAETPNDLDYSWDFDNGGTTKDATGKNVKATYTKAGTFKPKVTVTDPQGLSATATATVVVKDTLPAAKFRVTPKKPYITSKIQLDGSKSTGAGLKYSWDFGDGGTTKDASTKTVSTVFKKPGYRTVRLTVTDSKGRSSTAKQRLLVRRGVSCNASRVTRTGSWRVQKSLTAPKGDYCDNLGTGSGQDTMTYRFSGPQLDIFHGRSMDGGRAVVFVDGARKGTISFKSSDSRLRFKYHQVITGLSKGRHTMKLVVLGGTAYLDSFITIR